MMKNRIYINYTKFLIFNTILMFVLSFILQSVHAYSSLTNYKPTYGTLTSNVNFRSTPSTSSSIIKVLSRGTSVKMVATLDSFYLVQLGTNEVGLVSKSYVKSSTTVPPGASTYTAITKNKGSVNTTSVNFRRGPGTSFASIAKLSKGTSVTVVGYISTWYVCVTNSGTVGMISKQYVTLGSTPTSNTNTSNNTTTTTTVRGDSNEELILSLINNARTAAGLPKLVMDSKLLQIARLKAQDMVKNSYFSHTSPTYGSPFKMMDTYGISYKVAGENIAGNPDLTAAVNAWLNSETHRDNILSSSYNYIGVGVAKSETYGYVISTMFVGR